MAIAIGNILIGLREACKTLAAILVIWGFFSIPSTNALGWQFVIAGLFWAPFLMLEIVLRLLYKDSASAL